MLFFASLFNSKIENIHRVVTVCVPPADHSSFTVVPVTSAEASKGKAPVHLTYAAFFVPQRCPERTICSVKIG